MIREVSMQGGHFRIDDERRGPSYLEIRVDGSAPEEPVVYVTGNDGRAWQLANLIDRAINGAPESWKIATEQGVVGAAVISKNFGGSIATRMIDAGSSRVRSPFAMPASDRHQNVFMKATDEAIRKIRAQGLDLDEVELFTEEEDGRILLRWRKRIGG
jgi:hypothetical protein